MFAFENASLILSRPSEKCAQPSKCRGMMAAFVNTPAAWHEEKLKDRRVDRLVQGMLDWGSDHYLTPSTKTRRLRISLSETDPA